MFEVQNLKYATLATVSRCGMVWFSEEVLTSEMIFENFLNSLRNTSIDEGEDYTHSRGKSDVLSPEMQVIGYVIYLIRLHIYAKCIMNVHVHIWLIVSVFSNLVYFQHTHCLTVHPLFSSQCLGAEGCSRYHFFSLCLRGACYEGTGVCRRTGPHHGVYQTESSQRTVFNDPPDY